MMFTLATLLPAWLVQLKMVTILFRRNSVAKQRRKARILMDHMLNSSSQPTLLSLTEKQNDGRYDRRDRILHWFLLLYIISALPQVLLLHLHDTTTTGLCNDVNEYIGIHKIRETAKIIVAFSGDDGQLSSGSSRDDKNRLHLIMWQQQKLLNGCYNALIPIIVICYKKDVRKWCKSVLCPYFTRSTVTVL